MGTPRCASAEGPRALAEAVELMRELRQPGVAVTHDGASVSVFASVSSTASQGPAVPVWIGARGSCGLAVTGRFGESWAAPVPSYLPYER
ncbi:hypothetical protein [Streptomyces sp. NBC_01497]|uniref:hypothetical protein n=1 Tax=Streptomyces sp. NBC_01497 TaxID=2903885 RepID=UPI002E35EE18|nr:hypothetical protein [Streptomyces sp. NBC_01497]